MKTLNSTKASSGAKRTTAPTWDISRWLLAIGLLAMVVLYGLVRAWPRVTSPFDAAHVVASWVGMLAVPMLLGWASASIHEVLAKRRGRARTAIRRNTLITAWVFGLLMFAALGPERTDTVRTTPVEPQPKFEEVQPRISEEATNGSSIDSSRPVQLEAYEPDGDSTDAKPMVIDVVTPWVEIARKTEYVQANAGERRAIRDLYWHICVEPKFPVEQRTSAYWKFARDWNASESGASGDLARTTTAQLLREQQASVPSPVSAVTMEQWCKR